MGILLYNSNNSGCGQPHDFEYIDNQGRKTYYQRVPIISGYNEDFV